MRIQAQTLTESTELPVYEVLLELRTYATG